MMNQGEKKKKIIIIVVIVIVMLIVAGIAFLLNKNKVMPEHANTDKQKMEQDVDLSYEIKRGEQNKAQLLIKVSSVKGIKLIDCPNGNQIRTEEHTEEVAMDLNANIGEQYKYVITTEDGEKTEKIVNVNYYSSYEICNVTPYGYDVYIYGVNDFIKTVKYPTWTSANGKDDLIWYAARNIGNGIYYGRVNIHNQEAGEYITHLYFYDSSGNTITTTGSTTTIAQKNKNITNITADSLVAGVRDNNIPTGYCDMTVNGKTYNLEVINIDEFYKYNQEKTQYEIRDFAAGSYNVSRTAVIKCNGNLQIDGYVTSSAGNIDGNNGLTKVKGLYICTNGTLTNNGTISMTARGTYNTPGEDIYLWKNDNGSYETVPAVGAAGGSSASAARNKYSNGNNGINGNTRQTGGGGSGSASSNLTSSNKYEVYSGKGSAGTSYSGGTGGGGSGSWVSENTTDSAESGHENGGIGGNGNSDGRKNARNDNYRSGGGVGNPGGYDEMGTHVLSKRAPTGTGGLLIIYAKTFDNKYWISSKGITGDDQYANWLANPGGSSGGGSINIFYGELIQKGYLSAEGGISAQGKFYSTRKVYSGAGGNGTITFTEIN